jgi:Glycosyl transferase family 11
VQFLSGLPYKLPNVEKYTYRILGGFGNQIFQVLEAILLASQSKKNVELDFSQTGIRDRHIDYWRNATRDFEKVSVVDFGSTTSENVHSLHISKLKENFQLPHQGNFYIHGWTPSTREYETRNLIRRGSYLFNKKEVDSYGTDYGAIHIRRGDYLQSTNIGIASETYYRKALKLAIKSNIRKFTLFSDDLDYAKSWTTKFSSTDINFAIFQREDAITTLEEMSKYSFIITGNSTFSFWAHYFSGSQCCFPSPFYNNDPTFYKKLYANDKSAYKIMDTARIKTSLYAVSHRKIYNLVQSFNRE